MDIVRIDFVTVEYDKSTGGFIYKSPIEGKIGLSTERGVAAHVEDHLRSILEDDKPKKISIKVTIWR